MRNKKFVILAGAITALFVNFALARTLEGGITGATIERTVVTIRSDGSSIHTALETWEISRTGARRVIRRDAVTRLVTFEMVADPSRGGVYYVHRKSNFAEKASTYSLLSQLVTADKFLQDPSFVREEDILGYHAYLVSLKDEAGRKTADLWFVPEFGNFPFKWITYQEDGSKVVIEPTKVTLGEPDPAALRIGSEFTIKEADQSTLLREHRSDQQ
ncbi:MAG: hypothetical protein M3410_05035 [Acidobacteriota bacterium]|nr:hypothetical protein [Acidobacteriota bacterium]